MAKNLGWQLNSAAVTALNYSDLRIIRIPKRIEQGVLTIEGQ